MLRDVMLLVHPPAESTLLATGENLLVSLLQIFPRVSLPRRVLWRWTLRAVAVFLRSVHYFHYRRVWKPPNPARALLRLRVTAPAGRGGPRRESLARVCAKRKVGAETRLGELVLTPTRDGAISGSG